MNEQERATMDDLIAALEEAINCVGCIVTITQYNDCVDKIYAALAKADALQ